MKRMWYFARRNTFEILRDPISLFFGICFPIILLLLLSLINSAIPAQAEMTLYRIENLAPGVASFGLCFLALFSSMLISKDRSSSLMHRLFTSPMRAWEYIAGYCLPMLPIGLVQTGVLYLVSCLLGLPVQWQILLAIPASIPTIVLYASLGLLLGSVLSEKAVGGICGALLSNLAGWLSGTWFSIEMIGGVFESICRVLPFYPAAQIGTQILSGRFPGSAFLCVSLWALVAFCAAIAAFMGNIRRDR